jgi:glycosyltransferase involved in cell wall biosynthesis
MDRGARVLHVSQPVEEGVAMVVADLVRRQVASGRHVFVACPADGFLAQAVTAAGAVHLPWNAQRSPGPTSVGETRRLATLIREVSPDVVNLHSSKAGLAGRLAIRGRIPTVFTPHAWSFFHAPGPTGKAALAWERFAVRWTDAVVCNSEGERKAGEDAGIKARYQVIVNSSQIDSAGITQQQARADLDLDPDRPIVLCFGRYTYQKGQDILLEAWPRIAAAVPEAQLLLVGSGPDEEKLRALVPRDAVMSPSGERDRVVRWMLASDVMAFPSRWEGMSLAVLEALELGRAVVVTDCQGMAESLAGGAGTMVPTESPRELAEAIIPYVADRARAREIGELAAQRYSQTHAKQRDERFQTYEDLLDKLIAARR